jgi:lysozyme
MKRTSLLILLAVAAVIAAEQAFEHGWVRFNYPSRDRYPVSGVDVSHHQGEIDWAAVHAEGVVFAYVKATEGGDFVDPRFQVSWARARAAGLAVGAYHFFTFCRDGASQARNFLAAVPVAADALPPAVDLEFGGNCDRSPDWRRLSLELASFLALVRAAHGREPLLYMTHELYDAYRRNAGDPFRASPLWVRDVFRSPRWLAGRPWTMWQYASNGRVKGIRGPVDLNVFQGGAAAWADLRGAALPSGPARETAKGPPPGRSP